MLKKEMILVMVLIPEGLLAFGFDHEATYYGM